MQPQHIHFPTMYEMYPSQAGYHGRLTKQILNRSRFLYLKWCHRAYCSPLLDFLSHHPMWIPLFQQNPQRFNALLRCFADKRFNGKERLQTILSDLTQIEAKLGQDTCSTLITQERLLLAQWENDLWVYLTVNHLDPLEGFFSLSLCDANNFPFYQGTFVLLNEHQMLLTSIQGPKGEQAADIVRTMTKQLFGLRPMYLLVQLFSLLATAWECELYGVAHKNQAKYRFNDKKRLLFNYDAFWQENTGSLQTNGFWLIPQSINEQRQLEEIASKKRSMYRKRYAMLDKLQQDITQWKLTLS